MGLRESMFHLECTLTGQGRPGGPQRGQSQGREQKVREQRALRGAAMKAAVWPCQVTDNNNSINNNNNGGYQALCSHLPGIASLIPHS